MRDRILSIPSIAEVRWLVVALFGLVALEASRRRRGFTLRRRVLVSVDRDALFVGDLQVPRAAIADVLVEETGVLLVRTGFRSNLHLKADAIANNDNVLVSTTDFATADQDPMTLLIQNVVASGDVNGLFVTR